MQLYHDIPASRGVENALKRARQMVELEWVPVGKFPAVIKPNDEAESPQTNVWYMPYRPQKGMNYSSLRPTEKYVGFNISLETFMTALANPNSVLYTRDMFGYKNYRTSSYYGIVCSCFVSYCYDMPYRTPCAEWPRLPGILRVDTTRLENLQLCDIVLNVKKHIAMITDIQRDVDGNVHCITVSESVLPSCTATTYTPEMFRKFWLEDNYLIYRYDRIHEAAYTPSPYVHVDGDPDLEAPVFNTLMTDYGNKANYPLGESVEFSVFEDGWEVVEVTGASGAAATLPIVDGKAVFTGGKAGFYTAACRRGDEVSHSVEFCLVKTEISVNSATYAEGQVIRLSVSNETDPLVLWAISTKEDRERQRGYLTEEEKAAGEVVIPTRVAPGEYYVYAVARNKYGFYASAQIPFTVE